MPNPTPPAATPAYRFITTDADASGMRRILPLLIGADYPVESLPLE